MTETTNRQALVPAAPANERYAAAVLAVLCTLAIYLVLGPMLAGEAPYILFIFTIVIVKRVWSRGPALLATILGGISAWHLVLPSRFSFKIANRVDALNLAVFLAAGAGISFLREGSTLLPLPIAAGRRDIKRRIACRTAVVAGAVLVMVGMGLLFQHGFRCIRDAERGVAQTYRVMYSAESLASMMKGAESGQRGYTLTGDDSDLKSYRSAIRALPDALRELTDLTADSSGQHARCIEIVRLAREKVMELQWSIELRKGLGVGGTPFVIRSGQGEQPPQKLLSTLDGVIQEERRLLTERAAKAEVEDSRERWSLALGTGVLIISLGIASVFIERESVRREDTTESLRRHTGLLEQTQDSLLTFRIGGVIDHWSRGAETLYGYSREEALGRFSHELLQTRHPLGMARIDDLLGRDGQWNGELNQTTKDGRILTIEAQWTVALDTAGGKTVLEANRDISDRKRAENALREREMMLRLFVRHAPAAIAMLNREMCYLVVSRRWMADFHLGRRDIRGIGHYEVFPETLERWKEIYRRCLAGAVERCEEDSFPRGDGSVDWIRWEIRPWRNIDGSIGGVIIFSELITEQKLAKEKVRLMNVELEERVRSRTAELEAANRELEAFAHSVSHDLRAPLRSIDGWSLALLEDCSESLDAQGHKYLGRVRSEAQRMGRLIDDLLHLSRVSRAELMPKRVDLTSLAQTIVERLKEAHAERSIEFIVAPNLQGIGDPQLLEIALTNLFDNAVKFTGLNPEARVEFGQTEVEGNLALFVRDNGVGFEMAYAQMLFAPFQRLHKASEFPGTGIGLATVQRVIHRHGGRIWADAKVGEGATVYFTLGADKA